MAIQDTSGTYLATMGDGYEAEGLLVSVAGKEALRRLSALTAKYGAAIEAVERASDAAGWRCPECGELLSAHAADWNDYAFAISEPIGPDNQPQLIWCRWTAGQFCLPAQWTPAGGLVCGGTP